MKLFGDSNSIPCSCEHLTQIMKEGNAIYIDRKLLCEVTEVHEDKVVVTCKSSYTLTDMMPIHFPGIEVDMPVLTEQDEEDITQFAA